MLADQPLDEFGPGFVEAVATQNRASFMPSFEWSPPRPLAMSWNSAAM